MCVLGSLFGLAFPNEIDKFIEHNWIMSLFAAIGKRSTNSIQAFCQQPIKTYDPFASKYSFC
jgi:hypothetical protein